MKRIGVLALQGAFIEHINMLNLLGVEAPEVRTPAQLGGLDGLIIPGGESTTIGKLAAAYRLLPKLQTLAERGLPIWGTCAGMILLAKDIGTFHQPLLGLMDIKVARNAFGRQLDSFETELTIPTLDAIAKPQEKGKPFPGVFIRAPTIEGVGEGVEVLATLEDGTIVAARERNLLATAFHPELTADNRFHRYFLAMAEL